MPKKENLVKGEMVEILCEIGTLMKPLGYDTYYYKMLKTRRKKDGYMFYLELKRLGSARMTVYYYKGTLGVRFPGKAAYEFFNIDSTDEIFEELYPKIDKEEVFRQIKESLPHY